MHTVHDGTTHAVCLMLLPHETHSLGKGPVEKLALPTPSRNMPWGSIIKKNGNLSKEGFDRGDIEKLSNVGLFIATWYGI